MTQNTIHMTFHSWVCPVPYISMYVHAWLDR